MVAEESHSAAKTFDLPAPISARLAASRWTETRDAILNSPLQLRDVDGDPPRLVCRHRRRHAGDAILYAFDLLELDGVTRRHVRQAALISRLNPNLLQSLLQSARLFPHHLQLPAGNFACRV
jgi:hypothetical protein